MTAPTSGDEGMVISVVPMRERLIVVKRIEQVGFKGVFLMLAAPMPIAVYNARWQQNWWYVGAVVPGLLIVGAVVFSWMTMRASGDGQLAHLVLPRETWTLLTSSEPAHNRSKVFVDVSFHPDGGWRLTDGRTARRLDDTSGAIGLRVSVTSVIGEALVQPSDGDPVVVMAMGRIRRQLLGSAA